LSEDHALEPASDALNVPAGYVPVRSSEVLELDMGDGLIIYNHEGDLVHHLNGSAGIVWQLCDGDASIEELSRDIAEEYGLETATVLAQVSEVVAEFDALGLTTDARRIELRDLGKE
jgi:hypothetical protein